MELHAQLAGVAAEDAGEARAPGTFVLAVERDGGAVEDAVAAGLVVAGDDGVLAVAPDGVGAVGGLVFPGDVREGGGVDEFGSY